MRLINANTDHSDRAIKGTECILPLEHWDIVFALPCVGSGLRRADHPYKDCTKYL
jgi:hypothetical protein